MKINLPERRRGFSPASMSDIAFLLIIFLLVTVSIDDSGDIRLPKFRYAKESVVEAPITLTVGPRGGLSLDGRDVEMASLAGLLERRLDGRSQPVVHLLADESRPFSEVNEVLALLDRSGCKRIVLIAEERSP